MSADERHDTEFRDDEEFAREQDAADPLASFRKRFLFPRRPDGSPKTYFCGNSLGLQPRATRDIVERELADWADLAVDAHFEGRAPWYSYHEQFRDVGARLVGARPGEVVMMNGLTANLHLMMVSFYRPTSYRHRILIEDCAFPSDSYAVRSQIRYHGFDPDDALEIVRPRERESTLRTEDIEAAIDRNADSLALVLFPGVQYFTGQVFDIERITARARAHGISVGFDLAHAAGNVPLRLHDWNVDFAVWCSYKYLNGGPGAVAGCFVHERHGCDPDLPRFAGWWGNDPETRFRMHLEPVFVPRDGADGWQLSNPPILAMAPLSSSLEMFDEAGVGRLRTKSMRLTGYLQFLLDRPGYDAIEVLTPRDAGARGCQLSIRAHLREPRRLSAWLVDDGYVVDFRPPDVVRVAPVPLYNTFHEVWRFAEDVGRRIESAT